METPKTFTLKFDDQEIVFNLKFENDGTEFFRTVRVSNDLECMEKITLTMTAEVRKLSEKEANRFRQIQKIIERNKNPDTTS